MIEKEITKIGYYTLYEIKSELKTVYRVDSGKTIFLERFNKFIVNPYRDIKEFPTPEKAREYIKKKLITKKKKKDKVLKKLPKSLYLVLIREESTNKIFVKVGFTSKKFIVNRFSKKYGYDGYIVETILRRVESRNTEKLEKEIKDTLKKRSVKKYRPILENFSGYSECFDYLCLKEIIEVFDELTKKR